MTTFEKIFNIENLMRLGLSLGIIISLTVFIQIFTAEIFPEPNRDDFCPNYMLLQQANSESACQEIDGVWFNPEPVTQMTDGQNVTKPIGFCQENIECAKAYDTELNQHKALVFSTTFALSLLVFILGVFLSIKPVNIALTWTGVISLLFSLGNIPTDNRLIVAVASLIVAVILILLLNRKKIIS